MPFPARGQLHLRRVGSVLCPDFLSILSESLSECILRHLRTPLHPPSGAPSLSCPACGCAVTLRSPSKIFFFLLLASARRAGSNCVWIILPCFAFLHFESTAIPILHYPAFLPVPCPPVLRVKSLLLFGVSLAYPT